MQEIYTKSAPEACDKEIRTQVQARVDEQSKRFGAEESASHQDFSERDITEALDANERGDGWLYADLWRGKLCFDTATKDWYRFSGPGWMKDELNQSLANVDAVADLYAGAAVNVMAKRVQAEREGKKERADNLKKFGDALNKRIRALNSHSRRTNVLKLAAAGEDSLAVSGGIWDKNSAVLPCSNGVLELDTVEFRDGRPEDYIRTHSPAEWQGLEAAAPRWDRFLQEIFNDNSRLICYVQRLFGYAISGTCSEHVFPVFWGEEGRNGKGTLLEIIAFVLGDFAGAIPSETLLALHFGRSGAAPSPDIMSLQGKRMVWASEPNEGSRLNAGRIKWVVGGDTLVGRAPYGRHVVSFRPTHTLILLTNHKVSAPAEDSALWERIHLVPFTRRFVDTPEGPHESRRDRDLKQKLKAESAGILAWMVRGYQAWRGGGLSPPPDVVEATSEYRTEEDILGHFIEAVCDIGDGLEIQADPLYLAYQRWCQDSGHKASSQTKFGRRMKKRFDHDPRRDAMYYLGVALRLDTPAGWEFREDFSEML